MEPSYLFSLVKGILFLIPEAAVLAACVYYFVRQKSPDSILLSLGALVSMAVTAFYNIFLPIMQLTGSADFIYSSFVFTLISFISFAGYVSFAIGLFMLVLKYLKLLKSGSENKYPHGA
jgi:hypothetical protein